MGKVKLGDSQGKTWGGSELWTEFPRICTNFSYTLSRLLLTQRYEDVKN